MMPAPARAKLARLAAVFAVTLCLAGLIVAASPAMDGLAFAANAGGGRLATAASARHAKASPKHKQAKGQLPLKMMWGPMTLPDGASAFPIYHQLGVQVLQTQLI